MEVYDESLSLVHPAFWEGVRSSLLAGDVSSAWSIWSFSAEVSLVCAFVGGPVPEAGFLLGRGAAQFRHVPVGGPVVGRLRSDLGSGDGQAVHLFKDASVSELSFYGVGLAVFFLYCTVFLGMVLLCLVTWSLVFSGNAVVAAGPCGPLCSANLAVSPAVGLPSFGDHVRVLYDVVVDFLHKVVVHRGHVAVRGWRSWMLENDKVHPYCALPVCCDSGLTVDGCGFSPILIVLMSSFVELGSLSFVGLAAAPLIFLLLIGRLAAGFLTWVRLMSLLYWGPICITLSSISELRLVVWMVGSGEISRLFLRLGLTG